MFCGRGHCQKLRWVAVPSAAVEDEVRVFSEGIEHVPRWTRDGGHPRRHGPLPQDANFDEKLEGLSTPTTPMAAESFYLKPLIRCKMRAQIPTHLVLVLQGGRDVQDCDPAQTHLAYNSCVRSLRSADAGPVSQHRCHRCHGDRPQRSPGSRCGGGRQQSSYTGRTRSLYGCRRKSLSPIPDSWRL